MRVHVFVGVLSLSMTTTAFASMGPIPGEERFSAMSEQQKDNVSAGLGFGQVKEDWFVQLTLQTELNLGPVGLGLQIPLNLRLVDRNPKDDNDYLGAIRREDWDETREFARIIRYIRLGQKRGPYYLRVGDLAAEIGHGTIMSRYLNNIDINTRKLGVQFDVNTNYGGVETVVSDVPSFVADTPDSRVAGLRAHVKPWAFVGDPESFFNRIAVGGTVVRDFNAPYAYETDSAGALVIADDNPVVADDRGATVYGADAEVEVLSTTMFKLVPYTDLNKIDGAGWGWHAGVQAEVALPFLIDLRLPMRVEYRRFKQNYIPQYFSTFYEVERYQLGVDAAGLPLPKYRAYDTAPGSDGLNGYYGDLAFDFAGLVQIGAVYEDYEGSNPNLAAFLNVPALEIVQFKAYYERRGITDAGDIFKFKDDRSLAIAQARYQLYPFLFIVGRASRRWVLDTQPTSVDYGKFVADDSWDFGVEFSMNF